MSQKVERNTEMVLKKANDHWAFLVLFFFFFFKAFNGFWICFLDIILSYFFYSFSGFWRFCWLPKWDSLVWSIGKKKKKKNVEQTWFLILIWVLCIWQCPVIFNIWVWLKFGVLEFGLLVVIFMWPLCKVVWLHWGLGLKDWKCGLFVYLSLVWCLIWVFFSSFDLSSFCFSFSWVFWAVWFQLLNF